MTNTRNPLSGRNSSGFRFLFKVSTISRRTLFLPIEMKTLPQVSQLIEGISPLEVFRCNSLKDAIQAFRSLRKKYDFDYWAATEYFIPDVNDADSITPLRLNDAQHHVIDIFRKRYFQKKFGRYVISKSTRRVGLSTCIQAYILWMQTCQRSNNSYLCGPSAISINPLKTNLCRFLHRDVVPHDMGIYLPMVDWSAYFNTFNRPDAIRGVNLGFVHLADMSRWNDPLASKSSKALIAPVSAVLLRHYTLVVLEGDVPSKQWFDIKRFIRSDPQMSGSIRLKKLTSSFKNPFFINEVIVSDSSDDPYYFHIHLSQPRCH